MVLRGPAGEQLRLHRLGDRLRIDLSERHALVSGAGDSGFAMVDGAVLDLTAEDQALLHRVAAVQPLLWHGEDRRDLLRDAVLEGGVHVFGKPAYRFGLPGDGQLEIYLYEDGRGAGCRYRDPVAKKLMEYHFAADGEAARVLADGSLSNPWTAAQSLVADPRLFERPNR